MTAPMACFYLAMVSDDCPGGLFFGGAENFPAKPEIFWDFAFENVIFLWKYGIFL